MSNLGDTREFIHRDLVKVTKLLHMYLWSQLKQHYSSVKVTQEERSDFLTFPKSGECQSWEERLWPQFSRWVILLDAHITASNASIFRNCPPIKMRPSEGLLTTEKIKLTEALRICNFSVQNAQTSTWTQETSPAVSFTAPLGGSLHLFPFSLNDHCG